MINKLSTLKISLIIFSIFFVTRYLFLITSNFDNYELQPDSYWYTEQSDQVLQGNFNLLRPLFITSPFFTYFQSLIKFLFDDSWEKVLELLQVSLSSISAIYIYKLGLILFKSKKISNLALLLYCFYPFTLWYVGTFTQDIWFQSFLIIFMYYFSLYLKNFKINNLILSALIFSITFLTKSHILIFSLFIPLVIFFSKKNENLSKIFHILIFTLICLLSTLPYGLYNLKANQVYVLSSNGFGGLFILGHNDDAYINHIQTPELNSIEANRLKSVDYKIFSTLKKKTSNASPKEIQKIYFAEGLDWIKENPQKSKELLIFNFKRFFTPGLSKAWYSYNVWIVSILVSFPIMLFGYMALIKLLIIDYRKYSWMMYLFLSLLIFSLVFYYQGRFKIITLEPLLILLSSYGIYNFLLKYMINHDKFK